MRTFLPRSLAAFTFIAWATTAAAVPSPVPPPLAADLLALHPASLLPTDPVASIKFNGNSAKPQPATLNKVEIPGARAAFRVEVAGRSDNPYAVQAELPTEHPVRKGDVCLVRFATRSPYARQESGEGFFNCYFQERNGPNQKSVMVQLAAGPDWTTYEVPFEVCVDSGAGLGELCFSFGFFAQAVEISAVEVLDFGTGVPLARLPATRFTYAGREPDAAWRKQALARIEQIRTAPLKIVVTDTVGKPVPGVRVQARLVDPAFVFGSAVDAGLIAADTPEARIYRDRIVELFNTVTFDNSLKWGAWLDSKKRAVTLRAVDWITSHGLRLRGHNLVWPGWKFLPGYLHDLPNPGVSIPREAEAHIRDIVTATRGKAWAWDVLNEPVHERDLYKLFPETVSAEWFKQARRLDPHALLFVNEYGMLHSRTSPDFITRYLAFIKMLQANGAPLDGIGVQGHIGGQVRDPADVLRDLDSLQTSGLPIQITEFDVETKDEELQADYTRDFLIACYSHPGVSGFIQWGFWQGRHWKPDAAMFRTDWSEKPNARVWREWVLEKWRTHLDLTTDARGEAAARGHLGTYEVTVNAGTRVSKRTFRLAADGPEMNLVLP